jgi:O-antigen ligase/polysaccharide polymerase Wzy-like membrane protein
VSRPASVPAHPLSAPRGATAAYAGLILFTVLLYARPNDLLPIGTFPIVKIMTIGTLVTFFVERLLLGGPLSVMPRPFKYLLALAGFVVVSIPFGLDPSASFDAFTDVFLKTLLVFLLMINVVTSFRRLRLMMEVTVLSGAFVAMISLSDFLQGKNLVEEFRATGAVGGIFGNPNDLALALNVLLPLAIGLVLSRPNPFTKLVFGACAALLTVTSVVTYSRAGFITMVVAGVFLLVKVARRSPAAWAVGALVAAAIFVTSPGRVFTLFEGSSGTLSAAESATARWELVKRSIEVAGANPIRWMFGVGIGNFGIVSNHDQANHNAFLQVFNEVGLPAMICYILFLFSVFRIMGVMSRRYWKARGHRQVWLTMITIQTSLVAYAVGSIFASVAFLWYVYYPAAFALCLQQILARTERLPAQREVTSRVWYLRRVQH